MFAQKFSISSLGKLAYQIKDNDADLANSFSKWLSKQAELISARLWHRAMTSEALCEDEYELEIVRNLENYYQSPTSILSILQKEIDPQQAKSIAFDKAVSAYFAAKKISDSLANKNGWYKVNHFYVYLTACKHTHDLDCTFSIPELANIVCAKTGKNITQLIDH